MNTLCFLRWSNSNGREKENYGENGGKWKMMINDTFINLIVSQLANVKACTNIYRVLNCVYVLQKKIYKTIFFSISLPTSHHHHHSGQEKSTHK